MHKNNVAWIRERIVLRLKIGKKQSGKQGKKYHKHLSIFEWVINFSWVFVLQQSGKSSFRNYRHLETKKFHCAKLFPWLTANILSWKINEIAVTTSRCSSNMITATNGLRGCFRSIILWDDSQLVARSLRSLLCTRDPALEAQRQKQRLVGLLLFFIAAGEAVAAAELTTNWAPPCSAVLLVSLAAFSFSGLSLQK